jgi:WD40 repeat protein
VTAPSNERAPNTRTFTGHTQNVLSLEKVGDKLYSGSLDNTLREWDLETGVEVRNFVTEETRLGKIQSLYGDPEQDLIFSGTDNLLQEWDIKSGKVSRTFEGHTGWIRDITSDGMDNHVFSAGYDKSIKMWDRGTGKLIDTLYGHEGAVFCVVISNGLLYSGGQDNRMKVTAISGSNSSRSHTSQMVNSVHCIFEGVGPVETKACQDIP